MQPLETLVITMLTLFFVVTGRAEKFLWFIKNREDIKARGKAEGDPEKGSGKTASPTPGGSSGDKPYPYT